MKVDPDQRLGNAAEGTKHLYRTHNSCVSRYVASSTDLSMCL